MREDKFKSLGAELGEARLALQRRNETEELDAGLRRLDGRLKKETKKKAARSFLAPRLAFAAGAFGLALAGAWVLQSQRPTGSAKKAPPVRAQRPDAPPPSPSRPTWTVAGVGTFAFSPASDMKIARQDAQAFELRLTHGAVVADIVPQRNKKVRILAGPHTVEVVGTKFSVRWQRSSQDFEVKVEHGVVRVSSPGHGVTELTDGTTLKRQAPSAPPSATRKHPKKPPGRKNVVKGAPAAPRSPGAHPPSAKAPIACPHRQAQLRSAMATLEPGELERLARDCLLRRHQAAAVAVLEHLLLAHRQTDAGRSALFTLGRALRTSAPDRSLRLLQTYLQEVPDGPYRAASLGIVLELGETRLTEARYRSHASWYLRSFPNGPHAAIAKRIVAQSTAP